MKLWIDDIRPAPPGWTWVRDYDAAIEFMLVYGLPSSISFDHDLGADVETGYDVAKWIINADLDDVMDIPRDWDWNVHSANPVGAANIHNLISSYLEHKYRET